MAGIKIWVIYKDGVPDSAYFSGETALMAAKARDKEQPGKWFIKQIPLIKIKIAKDTKVEDMP